MNGFDALIADSFDFWNLVQEWESYSPLYSLVQMIIVFTECIMYLVLVEKFRIWKEVKCFRSTSEYKQF